MQPYGAPLRRGTCIAALRFGSVAVSGANDVRSPAWASEINSDAGPAQVALNRDYDSASSA